MLDCFCPLPRAGAEVCAVAGESPGSPRRLCDEGKGGDGREPTAGCGRQGTADGPSGDPRRDEPGGQEEGQKEASLSGRAAVLTPEWRWTSAAVQHICEAAVHDGAHVRMHGRDHAAHE